MRGSTLVFWFMFVAVEAFKQTTFRPTISTATLQNPLTNHPYRLSRVAAIESLPEFEPKNDSKTPFILKTAAPILLLTIAGVVANENIHGINFSDIVESLLEKIAEVGPYGYLYFGFIYVVAEILAIPATPLTASSGFLFGVVPGFLTVLCSATLAACISFLIGRFLLRDWAREKTSGFSQWIAIDKAIAKEGFKVVLLLRLSPLLPFAIANYLYGITSVDFGSYLLGTLIGFTPGTLAIVYTGSVGKDFFGEGGLSLDAAGLPWYAYATAVAGISFAVRTIAKIATDAIKEIEAADSEPDVKPPTTL